ncbi:MAG: matrixin family metalloprotease, partial [Myxococcaceae bacterium]|nr:matrixin family metalloprotease [Myxococcaceae bacterium]
MRRLPLALLPLVAASAWADPSGKKWFLDPCTTTAQCVLQNGATNGNRVCTMGRCLPEVRFAASIDNVPGRATLPGQQQVPFATVLQRMYASFERWTLTNPTCDPAISFAYLPGLTYASPQGSANVAGGDNENNVIWFSAPNWRHSSLTLGLTTNTFYPGELIDSDLEMNAATVTWGGGSALGSGDYDYESVVTHEAGHFIGFDHTSNSVAVMFATIGTGQIKRNLAGPDLSDVCTVYPGVSGSQGTVCSSGGVTCQAGLVCEGATGAPTRICTSDCAAAGAPCPTGFTCQPSTSGFACLPQIGAPDMCKFCTSGQDCSTGLCLTDGMGRNWCSLACNPSVPGQCGSGFTCQMSAGGSYCIPTAPCSSQCTSSNAATACAPGYGCTGGTCTPLGTLGSRCEVSEVCPSCAACATDEANPQIAFCRACCNAGDPICTGCSSTTCSAVAGQATMCLGINGRNERLCYPSAGASTCQACSTATPCAGGAACIGGRCRATCNPASPGACPACQPSAGFCACSAEEVSDVNEACSLSGTPLAICRNGLACVSGFCRQRCDVASPGSCPAGSTCQASGGASVCLPASSGQQCATCGPGGQCQPGLSCYANRCYPPCAIALPNQCATCVQVEPDPPVGSGTGICACPDQIVGPGSSC